MGRGIVVFDRPSGVGSHRTGLSQGSTFTSFSFTLGYSRRSLRELNLLGI